MKNFEMEKLSWIIQEPKGNHKCPYKKETKGDLTLRRGEDNVTMEAGIGVMWP